MEIKLIEYINIIECILCLHRTISSSNRTIRVLRYLHVFCQLLLMSSDSVLFYFNVIQLDGNNALAFFTSTANSFALIILAVYKSKRYVQMLKYFNMNHINLKPDAQYNKNLATIFKFMFGLSSVTIVLFVISIFFVRIDSFVEFICHGNQIISVLRFVFGFFALVSILNVMSEQLTSIVRSVKEFEVIDKGVISDVEYNEKLKDFEKWYATYSNLKESSKLFNNIYGLQVGVSF